MMVWSSHSAEWWWPVVSSVLQCACLAVELDFDCILWGWTFESLWISLLRALGSCGCLWISLLRALGPSMSLLVLWPCGGLSVGCCVGYGVERL